MRNKPNLTEHEKFMTDPTRWNSHTLWICLDCEFHGFGAPTTYHTINNPNHRLITESLFNKTCLEGNK